MQRIVGMLVFQSAEPRSLDALSPWFDMRASGLVEPVLAAAERQTHRRFFKTHLPYDALPIYTGIKFIHVARDGRDAALSFHNHMLGYTDATIARYSAVCLADPKFQEPFKRPPNQPAQFFSAWVNGDLDGCGDDGASYFHVENSYWAAQSEGVLLVHYNDLKRDREGQMRRVADYLNITVSEALWPQLVQAASFDAMKQHGKALLPGAEAVWNGGADRFLHGGNNGRWRHLFNKADLERYDAKVAALFEPPLAAWLAGEASAPKCS